MQFIRSIVALLILLLAPACGGSDADPISPAEREAARTQHPALLAEFGGSYQGEEARYLAQIGAKIAAAADLDGECTFTLVNSDVVNAFAVPGCYIYVTRGLMGIVNSEGELASVLAHEVGHIVGQHSRRQQKRSLLRGLGVLAVGYVTGSDRLTRIAGQAATFFTLRYSRKHEYEADDLGLSYLQAAGYDPYAAPDMLMALGRQESFIARTRGRDEARSIPEWVRTHPLTENRIVRARQAAAATGLKPDQLPENETAFLREVDGLLYGDDPAQGFVMGRRFAHPLMRVAFEAPPGFTLTNSPQAISIEGPDGVRGEFSGGKLPSGGLDVYVASLLAEILGETPVTLDEPRRLTIDGMDALVQPAVVRTSQGSLSLVVAAYARGDGSAHHFLMVSDPAANSPEALDALFTSLRSLSVEEAGQLRPRRLTVRAVRPSDTVAGLASQMASESALEHFLMLNGRRTDQALKAGELVKLVRYSAN